MSVRARDGYLHLDFRFEEQRYRVSTKLLDTPENVKFCKNWDATIRHEIATRTFSLKKHFPGLVAAEAAASERTFKQDAEAWLAAHRSTWAELTYRKFRNDLNARVYGAVIKEEGQAAWVFGERPTRGLKPRDLRMLREAIAAEGRRKLVGPDAKKPLANQTINKYMQPVKEMLLEMFADGELPANPIPRKLELKERRLEDIHPFTDEDLKKLFREVHKPRWRHYEPMIHFIFESSFRPEENYGMLWAHTDLKALTICVREVRTIGIQKSPKTEFAAREVDITAGMAQWLRKQRAISYLRGEHVWVTVTGRPIETSNFVADIFKPLCKAAGIKYRPPKQARHTWATRHISRGTDPRWMAVQMGTSLPMIFKTYAAAWNRARDAKNTAATAERGHVYGHAEK